VSDSVYDALLVKIYDEPGDYDLGEVRYIEAELLAELAEQGYQFIISEDRRWLLVLDDEADDILEFSPWVSRYSTVYAVAGEDIRGHRLIERECDVLVNSPSGVYFLFNDREKALSVFDLEYTNGY
jgi:hypothetical protein